VVEIRCPHQTLPRAIATAIAPFRATVHAMLTCQLRSADPGVVAWHQQLAVDGALADDDYDLAQGAVNRIVQLAVDGALAADDYDLAQGAVNRIVRLAMNAEATRSYFRAVDTAAGAYREPWTMGESRFIANANPGATMQHRRAYLEEPGRPNGHLVKRWPAGPAMH
jgi:hypothetical protein